MLFLEKEIESAKINLSLKHDFNLVDAFAIFDLQRVGCITEQDFVTGLTANLEFTDFNQEDIFLFFKKVDRKGLGRITYK
jgi:Ca2+-binding EF-hand superfamily protein